MELTEHVDDERQESDEQQHDAFDCDGEEESFVTVPEVLCAIFEGGLVLVAFFAHDLTGEELIEGDGRSEITEFEGAENDEPELFKVEAIRFDELSHGCGDEDDGAVRIHDHADGDEDDDEEAHGRIFRREFFWEEFGDVGEFEDTAEADAHTHEGEEGAGGIGCGISACEERVSDPVWGFGLSVSVSGRVSGFGCFFGAGGRGIGRVTLRRGIL